jgi:hypothetical protein
MPRDPPERATVAPNHAERKGRSVQDARPIAACPSAAHSDMDLLGLELVLRRALGHIREGKSMGSRLSRMGFSDRKCFKAFVDGFFRSQMGFPFADAFCIRDGPGHGITEGPVGTEAIAHGGNSLTVLAFATGFCIHEFGDIL